MSQYVRDKWGPEQGFPRGPVYAIAQTADGYLWFGTQTGLVRFDGLNFRVIGDASSSVNVTNVLGLASDGEGSLWLRLQGPRLLRYRNGAFDSPSFDTGWPYSNIGAMSLSNRRELLILRMEQGAIVYRQGKFEMLASTSELPRSPIMAMTQSPDGDIWMGTRDAGVFRLGQGNITSINAGLPDPKVNCLFAASDRDVWIGTDAGIARWNGEKLTIPDLPESLSHVQVLTMERDRDANLWVGTNSHGLLRLNDRGVAAADPIPDGLTAVTAIFEDREGNLWVGTSKGIERFRDSAFVTYSAAEGLPSNSNGPVHVGSSNRTWFAPVSGGLHWMTETNRGRITQAGLDRDVIYSIAGADNGDLWVGRQRGGLTHLRTAGSAYTDTTYTQADGLAQNSVYAVHVARDATVWAATLNGGVSKLSGGKFTTYTIENGLASNTVESILNDTNGTMWFATSGGLSRFAKEKWQTFTVRDGLPSNQVICLFEDSSGVLWIGTAAGIAFLDKGRIGVPSNLPGSLKEQILGIAEDRLGSLWISTSNHVVRVAAVHLLNDSLSEANLREFGRMDGLHSVEGVKRHRSVVADSGGRIWFSMHQGLSLVDPARVLSSSVPALPAIQTISVDGETFEARDSIHVSPGPRRISIGFAGLSLSLPERVQFRYMLEPFDSNWSLPAATREAVYTNLGPGTYRFRLLASNGDGTWNGAETVMALEIAPAFWQTWWFILAIVMFFVLALVAVYRLRLHQLTRQLNLRFEERLGERTRIAQDLHDTLLQGFLSASMQLDVAADRLPEDSPVKPSMTRILQLMRRVNEEGRNAVKGLRSSDVTNMDLQQAFSRMKQELAVPDSISFQIVVEGRPRPLHPIIRDEAYRIGREALVNAFRHARARHLEVELEYTSGRLRVLVRDDGCGISHQVLTSGRDGHFGLSGMRERAERIGATVSVRSREDAGTEVELSVPGNIAYEDGDGKREGRFMNGFRKQKRGKIQHHTKEQE
jgi:signal transduction histidine kinase/streptogramin lyase